MFLALLLINILLVQESSVVRLCIDLHKVKYILSYYSPLLLKASSEGIALQILNNYCICFRRYRLIVMATSRHPLKNEEKIKDTCELVIVLIDDDGEG